MALEGHRGLVAPTCKYGQSFARYWCPSRAHKLMLSHNPWRSFWSEPDQAGSSPLIPTNDANDFRILVAGGAGSASTEEGRSRAASRSGGHGGGITGGWPNTNENLKAGPGTQTQGGRAGQSGFPT